MIEMINKIKTVLSDVSLTKNKGKFLADKSYGFDTVYFIAKFIYHNARNNVFNKRALGKKAIEYTKDVFQLKPNASGARNYFSETLNLLTYSNILTTDNGQNYVIAQPEILKYISEQPENAYIFLYLLTYMTVKNDNLLSLYEKYAKTKNLDELNNIINEMHNSFEAKSVSIGRRDTNWSKQLVKYSITVLGLVNNLNYISREFNVNKRKVSIKNAALNVAGRRSSKDLPKKNGYLNTFNLDYVKYWLKDELIVHEKIEKSKTKTEKTIEDSLAELKLVLLDVSSTDASDMDDEEKEQFIEAVIKTRNQAIQTKFKKGLLENNKHVCPICGFSFEKFLIASHIKRYSDCENTSDAVNHHNGFLMCPNHDKLFENARYMTIDAKTGEIILSKEARNSEEFKNLAGTHIPETYLTKKRQEYLEWHNNRFREHNPEG